MLEILSFFRFLAHPIGKRIRSLSSYRYKGMYKTKLLDSPTQVQKYCNVSFNTECVECVAMVNSLRYPIALAMEGMRSANYTPQTLVTTMAWLYIDRRMMGGVEMVGSHVWVYGAVR